MKFEAKLLVIGTEPKIDWVGRNSVMVVKFSAAENHNVNEGSKDNPEWVTKSTSWFNLEAWGETAEALLEEDIGVGTALEVTGVHKIDKVTDKNGPAKYYPKYTIRDFKVYPKNERN